MVRQSHLRLASYSLRRILRILPDTSILTPWFSDELPPPDKTEKEIQTEIQAIFRQITASVTFLPQLDGNCTFNVLVYADADSDVPIEWGDSDAKEIKDGEKVQLRSFSTSNHRVDTLVSYRYVPWSKEIEEHLPVQVGRLIVTVSGWVLGFNPVFPIIRCNGRNRCTISYCPRTAALTALRWAEPLMKHVDLKSQTVKALMLLN